MDDKARIAALEAALRELKDRIEHGEQCSTPNYGQGVQINGDECISIVDAALSGASEACVWTVDTGFELHSQCNSILTWWAMPLAKEVAGGKSRYCPGCGKPIKLEEEG